MVIRAPGICRRNRSYFKKKAAEQIVQYVKNSMDKTKIESQKESLEVKESIADELLKLVNLKEKGVLSDEEFLKMKKDLLNK